MKKIFYVFIVLSILVCAFCLASCSSNNSDNNSSTINNASIDNPKTETMQKHTVQLTMDNYLEYLEIRSKTDIYTSSSIVTYEFEGALHYAYYDNVVITYTINNETKELRLSAGGYGLYYRAMNNSTTATIVDVSGSVTYWM